MKNIVSLYSPILFCAGAIAPSAAAAQTDERPNIIFILTDDQRWDALGATGNSIIQTPEMDRLAHDGVIFRNAFVTTPISAASRASILTGLYERTHGYTFQTGDLKAPYVDIFYPSELKKSGYYTGYFGKLGVDIPDAPSMFDKAEIYDRGPSPDRRSYYYKDIDGDTVHLTEYTGYRADEFLRNAPSDRPFCLMLGFSAPHAQDNAPEQYFWSEKSDTLFRNTVIPDPLLADERYFNALPEEVRNGFNRVRWHWRFDTPEKYQASVKGYYRMIHDVDREIGNIRSTLKDLDLDRNTIIIFMGDNGYYLGERQLAGKWLMHENSLRVPLIIYDPKAVAGKAVDAPVLNIDIPYTILDMASADIPPCYQGQSLKAYYNGDSPKERDTILFEHLWNIKEIPSSEAVRTDRYKYIHYRFIDAPEELYDLTADPLETNNIAADPAMKETLEKLRTQCGKLSSKYESEKLTDK